MLDACALVAYLRNEEGGDRVEALLFSGQPIYMSAVNVLEVCYDTIKITCNVN